MTNFTTSLGKSLKWTAWNVFFGLLPAWLALFFSWVNAEDVGFVLKKILIKEHALMFFSVAVITAITIDVKMDIDALKPYKATKYRGIATWSDWASYVVVFTSTLIYAQYYNKTEITDEVLANITKVSVSVFAFTIIYILALKFYQIHRHPF